MQLDTLKTPSGFLKLLEIALTIIIIGVIGGVGDSFFTNPRAIFCGGVMVTAMVVTPLLLVMFLLGHATELHKMPFEMLINAVLAVFMVSAGGVIIHTAIKPAHSYQDLLGSVDKPGPHQDLLKSVNKLGSHLLESVNKPGPHQDLLESVNKPGPHQDLLESVNKLGSFYYDSIKGKAAGSFAIINSIIYGVDTFFAKQSIGIVE